MGFDVTPIKSLTGNAYLLTDDCVALVDTLAPLGLGKLERKLADCGVGMKDIDLVLVTHCHFDHVGNLARIKEDSGATVIASEADAAVIEGREKAPPPSDISVVGRLLGRLPQSVVMGYQKFETAQVDRKVTEGDEIGELGLKVVVLPGHTRGGVCYLDRGGRRAFIGDIVSNVFGLGMPALCASHSLELVLESQERLAGLDIDTAFCGHGNVIQPDASLRIGKMVEKKRDRYLSR